MRSLQFLLFFVTFFSVYLGSSSVVILHTMNILKPYKFRYIVLVIMIIMSISVMFGRFLAHHINIDIAANITRIGYIWMSLLTYMFLYSLSFFILQKLGLIVLSDSFRIKLFSAEVFVCIAIFITGYTIASTPVIKNHQLTIDKNFDSPLRVVQISDLHLGFMYSERQFQRVVDMIALTNPDILLITGDFLENENGYTQKKGIGKSINRLNPRYGIFGVPGNHEYINKIDRSLEYKEYLGINILRDSSVLIDETFYLIGRDDESAPRFGYNDLKDLDYLLAGKDTESRLSILMTHQVSDHSQYEDKSLDLVISGHTHQGQFFPWNLVVKGMYDIAYGLEKAGDTFYYVTSGTGYWGPPFRLGTRSEIVVFDIVPKSS